MTEFIAQLIAWLNIPMNALGRYLLAPTITHLPGWLSNTVISAVMGILLLIIFKYTSDQRAIGEIRDGIKADLLALKLFKDSVGLTFRLQGRLFRAAFYLLAYAVRPMLVMILPVSLVLSQMALWYQSQPLQPGERTIITMQLSGTATDPWPSVKMASLPGEVITGPVRIISQRRICWDVRINKSDEHNIVFDVNDQRLAKSIAVGEGFMPVSVMRPGCRWKDVLLNPLEKPFPPQSLVQGIDLVYPDRPGRAAGSDWWLVYFFIASMVFALLFKPFIKVRI